MAHLLPVEIFRAGCTAEGHDQSRQERFWCIWRKSGTLSTTGFLATIALLLGARRNDHLDASRTTQ